ncbi:MAG: TrkH family potassium uptake protein [candidate division Zixibacteria bacterium]|jgi:trk system potassium uptake protein TrkH|nr:TrkH family potassium uptake protein [candidate division Zixibacteria bacterium]
MELLGKRPGRKLIAYFAGAILLGSILLALPLSSAGPDIHCIDALFTSTSAVCVTGLIVLDTPKDFSLFGQVVILTLIQLGGLGIMTFATALLLSITPRLSFRDNLVLSESLSTGDILHPHSILRAVLITTAVVEAVGTTILFFVFRADYPADQALWHAIFHSVSAFCNAGFSTFSSSLEHYQTNLTLIGTVSALIILGGLGFTVVRDVAVWRPNGQMRLSLHTKLCLTGTAVLIVAGTLAFVVADRGNVFAHMSSVDAFANAFFQAVTARTAGFNTIPQTHLTEVSLLVTMLLMFIGACPGSTGGGTKVTTAMVIVLLAYNRLMGRRSVAAFKRSLSPDSVTRALTIMVVASITIAGAFVAMMFLQERPVPHLLAHGWFVDSLFEVVSAFATVGLSLGATSQLEASGKIIAILLMFVGRVGLLTLLFSLSRGEQHGELVYPDEPIMVG